MRKNSVIASETLIELRGTALDWIYDMGNARPPDGNATTEGTQPSLK